MNDLDETLAAGKRLLIAGDVTAAAELLNGILRDARTIEPIVGVAKVFYETGRPAAALEIWAQLRGAKPNSVEIAYELARTQLAAGHAARAAETFEEVLRLSPDLPAAHLGLSVACIQLERWDRAETSAGKAHRREPGAPDPLIALAKALTGQGRQREAIDAQAQAVSTCPDRLDIRYDLGLLQKAAGDGDGADATFNCILDRAPDHGHAAEQLGLKRLDDGLFEEAIGLFERAIASRGPERPLLRRLAQAQYELGRYDNASDTLQSLLDSDPNDVTTYAPLAAALIRRERMEEAKDVCDRGLAMAPGDTDIRRMKGQALFYLGKNGEVEELFERLPGSLLPPGYFDSISFMLRESLALDGDVIECGVYKGGATVELAKLIEGTSKVVHACDTFEGIPEPSEFDNYHIKGDFGDTSLQAVETRWKLAGVANRIVPHKGLFEETFPSMTENRYCFAFLDADFYVSMLQALDHVYTRIAPGGWIVIDDYGWIHCAGCKIAVDEFLADKPERGKFGCVLGCLYAFKKL